MRFRLPKPLRGWREFGGEVGVIVLGVLIALGAQQVVEGINEREAVAQLRSALRAELADDRARWEDMRASDPCTLQRLDTLDRWVGTAPAEARLVRPYHLLLWNMHSSAWDIAKTSPAAGNIPLDERLRFGDLYGAVDNWRAISPRSASTRSNCRHCWQAPTSPTADGRSSSMWPRRASCCAVAPRITHISSRASMR